MESPRIGLGTGTVVIDTTHTRQSTRPRSFEDAMRGGVATLLKGAEVATGSLGGPMLSAAIRGMRRDVELGGRPVGGAHGAGTGGAPLGGSLPGVLGATVMGSAGVAGGGAGAGYSPGGLMYGPAAGAAGVDPGAAALGAGVDPSLDAVRQMQRDSHDYNIDLLLLQESTQRENREFQTVSNTLKALHDTAKAAISNLHA
jgi:hypothetical protein